MKRTLKAGVLASSHASTALVSLIVFAVLSRTFDKHDYATYRQTILAYHFAAPLLVLGLPAALFYFVPASPSRARALVLENVGLLGIMGFAFGIFLFFGGNQLLADLFDNPDLAPALKLFAAYPLLAFPVLALPACLMAAGRVVHIAVFNVLSRVVLLVAVFLAVAITPTPVAALSGEVIAAGVVLVPALLLMLRASPGPADVSFASVREQLRYCIPLGLGTVVGLMNLEINKFIVASSVSPESFAIFINGTIRIPLIAAVTGSAAAVILPELVTLFKERRHAEGMAIWRRAAVKCSIIILPVTALMFVLAPEIMVVVFSETYRGSAEPFRWVLLLLPARVVFYGTVFQAAGRSRLVLIRAVTTTCINVPLCLILVHHHGYMGAVYALVAAIYVYTIPFCIVSIARIVREPVWRVLPLIDLLKVAVASLAGLVPCLLALAICGEGAFVRLAVGSLTYVIAVIPLLHLTGVIRFGEIWRSAVSLYARVRPAR